MPRIKAFIASTLLTMVAGAAASDQTAGAGAVAIEDTWARASIGPAKNGAAYLTVVNEGEITAEIVAMEAPVAERAEIHEHFVEDDIARMHRVQRVQVAPGTSTVFEPGGLHVMLVDLKAPLDEGESFPLTVEFADAGKITVNVEVMGLTYDPAAHGSDHAHGD